MRKPYFIDSFPVWIYYPSLIRWKIRNRELITETEDNHLPPTINASIISDLSTFWEGIVFEMQNEIFLERFEHVKGDFNKNLIDYFYKKLSKATWSKYIEFFDLLLGEKLSSRIPSENWKAIKMLFSYRNMIVHGKEIEIHYYEEGGQIKANSPYTYKDIFNFLKEKNLIELEYSSGLNSVDILNNQVIDFFFDNTITFLEELFKIFPEISTLKVNFDECLNF